MIYPIISFPIRNGSIPNQKKISINEYLFTYFILIVFEVIGKEFIKKH
jgi:hypothetical protein